MKHKSKKLLSLLLALLMLVGLTMPADVLTQPARAAAGQTPAHSKSVTSNGDGTYTIELTVTGDAESETTVTGAVNVIVVIDTSRSMTSYNTTYNNSTVTRADAAEKVVYDFAHGLFGYTAKGADVEMALVTFNASASVVQGWTKTESAITGKLSSDGTNGSRQLTYSSGTNWEAALQALTREDEDNPGLLRTADKDRTFVIFVTDGAPSQYVGSNFTGGYANNDTGRRQCYEHASDEAYTIQQFQTNGATEKNTTLYAIYAFGDEADFLDDLIYFSNNNADRPAADGGVTGSTVATEGYFNAGSTDELQKAIAKIFKDIADFMGIAAVSIDDGTTSDVAVEGGEVVDLLEIDENSYQYWLTVPLNSSMQFTRVNSDAQTITYTVTEDEETEGKYKISWGSGDNAKSVTVEGSITSTGDLRYEWTGSDDLYAKAPPEAELVGSSVKWDLNSVGTLLTGVTYSVTFEVYPSQTTLDILADMKNDPYVDAEHTGAWGKLPAEVQKYIDKESGALTTNTGAKLTYTDTRLENPKPTTSDFNSVDGVESKAVEQLALAKKWMNALDKYTSEPITFDVLRDGKKQYTVTLSDDNDWSGSVYISIGIINKRGKVVSGSEGHDFTFKEPENVSYHWELDIPTVHPMMINGKVTMLIKVDAKHPAPSGAKTYTINGATYYVDDSEDAASLTATNERRSYLDIVKVVDGEDADPEQVFPFTITVKNSRAATGTADNLDSDYWVWFSVYNGGPQDRVVSTQVGDSGPVYKQMSDGSWTGYYYAKSETAVQFNLLAGDSLRFLNLPTDSTYTIVETPPESYVFTSSGLVAETGEPKLNEDGNIVLDENGMVVMETRTFTDTNADETFKKGQTTSGTIVNPNTDYTVTYKNTYNLSDIEITKVWEDNSNQDGKRPTTEEFKADLVLKADGTDVTSANASKLTVTDNEDNTYTVKWTGLDRYADGKEIKYTVEESAIDGYDTEGSPAEDGGTITNSHTPEQITIYVEKIWIGPAADAGATIHLFADKVDTKKTVKLTETTTSGSFANVDKYANGNEIAYTVTEDEITGYTTTGPTGTGTQSDPFIFTNINDERIAVYAKKVWDDADDQDGKRPDSVEFTLLADGKAVAQEGVTATAELDADGGWACSWTNLYKYDQTTGEEITYSISEGAVVNYDASDPTGDGTKSKPFTITNSYTPVKTNITVTKVWDDASDQDGKRPDSVTFTITGSDGKTYTATLTGDGDEWTAEVEVETYYDGGKEVTFSVDEKTVTDYTKTIDNDNLTITNKYTPGKTSITVTKVWDDAGNQDGKRPDSVEFTVTGSDGKTYEATLSGDGDKWTAEIEVDTYYDGGKEVEFTVDEEDVDGYEKDIDNDSLTITNSYTPETMELEVTKVWDDSSDQDGKRPDSVKFTVTGSDGNTYEATLTGTGDTWNATIENVAKYYDGGKEVTFTVDEADVEGYEKDIDNDSLTITNSYETETDAIKVTKIWDDNSDQDGKRPDSVTFTITGSDGNTYTATLSGDGDKWTKKVKVQKYMEGGKEVEFTVTEEAVEGYEATIDGLTITNSYETEKDTIKVTKIWDDANDQDGVRPESVTFTVTGSDGNTYDVELSGEGSTWTAEVEVEKYYNGGEEVTFTVDEAAVTDYTKEIDNDSLTITNSYKPGMQTLTVKKVWSDSNDQDGLRPDEITVKLLLEGKECEKVTLDESNGWKYSWDLPKKADGKDLIYTVDEDVVPDGYEKMISGSAEKGFIITNVHEITPPPPPPITDIRIEIIKVWEDNNNASGIRTDTVEVTLMVGDVKNLTRNLGDPNDWKYECYMPGGYDYRVVETPVEGYDSIVTQSPIPGGIRFTVTNKLTKTPDLNTKDHVAYIVGYPDGTVRPDRQITRAEVATIFFRLLTDEARDKFWSQTNPYPDVKADDWFNNAISTLTKMGIINGYEDGTFRPNNPITRAELTKMAVSFFSSADKFFGKTPSFSDVPADAWYTRFIAAAEELGLINGYPDGTFRPNNYITRAETCTIVNRTLGRGPHKDHLLPEEVMINWPDNLPTQWYYEQIQEATNSHDYEWITEIIEKTTVEQWLAKLPERDWVALEQIWSTAHSAPGGEVMG